MSLLTAAALVAGLLTTSAVIGVVAPGVAAASGGATGDAGLFVATTGRILDTRNGNGGYTTPMPGSTWRSVSVGGNAGVPTSGVSAVSVTFTIVNATATGNLHADMGGHTSTATTYMNYLAGQSISNAAVIAVSSDGKINVLASATTDLLIDVQGYYTTGTSGAGGYTPLPTAVNIVNTANGLNVTQAKVATGGTITVPISGLGGVPANATAAMLNFAITGGTSTSGTYIVPYPAGSTKPATSLNAPAQQSSAVSATVALGTAGKISIYVGVGGPIDITIAVEGYFTPSTTSAGQFTPGASRIYDSRSDTSLAANATRTIQVGGVRGVPAVGSGIAALAVEVSVIPGSGATGRMQVWPDDGTTSNGLEWYSANAIRSDFMVIRPGADGGINFQNTSGGSVDLIIDVEGWYASATGALQGSGQTRTQKYVALQAGGAGGSTDWVTYKYRQGTTGSFANVPVANVTVPGTTTHPSSWPVVYNTTAGSFDPYTWDLATTVGTTDQLVQVIACHGTSNVDPAPVCSMPNNIELAAHAFGDSYDSQQVGPGLLATLTGDYQISATDVNAASYQGKLTVGRTFTTLAPSPEQANADGVFGPGWTSDVAGPGAGDASATVTDNSTHGYLAFTESDGSVTTYQATTPIGTYPTSFLPIGNAAGNAVTVSKTSATQIVLTDSDGSKTTWQSSGGVWAVVSVVEAGSNSTTAFTTDGQGRPTRILGAVPSGISCSAPDTTPGCRSLTFSYTTVTVGGIARTRLASVNLVAYDPSTLSMATTALAAYSYDSNGHLWQEWDPQITPSLKTTYTYDANGRLSTLTPPGMAAWTLTFDGAGRISTMSRPDPSGTTATSTFVYDIPVAGGTAPVDVSATAAGTWGQIGDPAAVGTAVFGPDHAPSGTVPSAVTTADWPYASIDYLDLDGRNVNTASYGAGTWQVDSTVYDSNGNDIWDLSPGNRSQALSPTSDTTPTAAAATTSSARAAFLAATTTYDSLNPAETTDTFGPLHPVTLANDTTVEARNHHSTAYDEGSPNGDLYLLPTTQTQSAQTLDGVDHDKVTTRLGYEAIQTGDTTGWKLGQATSQTVQMGASPSSADLVTITRYNSSAQIIESRLPAGTSGGDARSTLTSYYSASGTGSCVSADQAGLVCSTAPAAQPNSGNPLPTTTTVYNMYGEALTQTAVAGATTRASSATYDRAGRPISTSLTVTPAADGGTPSTPVTMAYSSTTGLPTTQVSNGQTLTTGYDAVGQITTYTDATGNTTTFTHDTSNRITSAADGKGTTTYGYDSATEHRGLVTTENIGVSTAPATFAATYNADGQLSAETYPTGLVAQQNYDNNGDQTYLNYTQGSSVWMTFSATRDPFARIAVQNGSGSAQRYRYDAAGRLTSVADILSTGSTTATCTTRNYGFDADSNRTSLSTYPDGGGISSGNCSTSTTPTVVNSTYDQADRLTNAGYAYDTLGRTTTIPGGDAQGTGSKSAVTGTFAVSYFSNDMVATQTQGSATRAYTVDPERNRILTSSDGTVTSTNHYSDSSDSPIWQGTGTAWTRNLKGIDGNFAGTQTSAGAVTFQISNLHGDLVGSFADSATATLSAATDYTEYGQPRLPSAASDSYGYLGVHQRSADPLGGIIVMGARMYNPASGRFLSTDPIPQGNADPYVYPADPVNSQDESGQCLGPLIFLLEACIEGAIALYETISGHSELDKATPPVVRSFHKNSNSYTGVSWGYVIFYKANNAVWKFGITSVGDGNGRPRSQLATCKSSNAVAMLEGCDYGLKRFTNRQLARNWEVANCTAYGKGKQDLPPGSKRC